MSTILEALKKSEQERKLNSLPTLSDMPPPKEASKWPLYLALAIIALALAIAVLAFVWWNSGTNGAASDSSLQRESQAQVADQGSPAASEMRVASGTSEAANIVDESITVNVVSYSGEIAERFAMINGKMVREGEFVRAGLQVVEIRQNTVVLNLRGKRIIQGP